MESVNCIGYGQPEEPQTPKKPIVHKAITNPRKCCDLSRLANSKIECVGQSGGRMFKMLSNIVMKNLLFAAWKNSSRP